MPRKKIHENGWDKTPEASAYRYQYIQEHYGRLNIMITKELKAEIEQLAAGSGMSMAKLIAEAVDAWKQLHKD